MNRSDVRELLHQAALDVARLAEPPVESPCGDSPSTCVRHESLIDAEREARRLTSCTDVAHVVVEVRHEHDPPGVEAMFVACPEDAVGMVPLGREIVLRADPVQLRSEAVAQALRHALSLSNGALQTFNQGCEQEMYDLLWDLNTVLRAAQGLPPEQRSGSRGTSPNGKPTSGSSKCDGRRL